MGGRKRKALSAEDKALWDRVARSTKPMRNPKIAYGTFQDHPVDAGVKPSPKVRVKDFHIGERASTSLPNPQISPALTERLAHAPVKMDHGLHRQMIRGKLKPEARIDLHGLTLADAHPRLIHFIQSAAAEQKRLVLVITGKGKDRDDPGPIPIRRGVLRHQVPAWLNAPPLGALVLDIRQAHIRHGGDGAYYVYLRRMR